MNYRLKMSVQGIIGHFRVDANLIMKARLNAKLFIWKLVLRMVYYSVSDTGILEKGNPSAPIRSGTKDLPITSSDALPLSYRRLVGAKAIKLGS